VHTPRENKTAKEGGEKKVFPNDDFGKTIIIKFYLFFENLATS
jgi:hypothetical protein